MKLDDDFDDLNKGKSVTIATVISIAVCTLVVVVVLVANKDSLSSKRKVVSESVSIEETDSVGLTPDPYEDISVEDLDFYNMFDETESTPSEVVDAGLSEHEKEVAEGESDAAEPLDETNDGKHTKITYASGQEEWVSISPYLTKHSYDFSNLIDSNGRMKYFENGRCVSYVGVDISKDNDYIDFNKVLKDGIDFCMIRVGARGYETGDLYFDDYYKDNLKRATDAGLDVGVYFLSSAITEDEAREEADYLINLINGYTITYPVCFMMSSDYTDAKRTDNLTKAERTAIAMAFLDQVKASGYKPMLYGNKEWLIKNYDMSKLIKNYDIWLSETEADAPTYPYSFDMWKYTEYGTVDGIAGYVDMDIAFTDFSLK